MIKSILVPTDFSKNAREAFAYAAGMAQKLRASITLYHAWSSEQLDPRLSFKGQKEAMAADKRNKERRLKLWAGKAAAHKIDVSYVLDEEAAGDGIIDLTATGEYDLVVIGTKGASGIRTVFIGSIASAVLTGSKIPVVAVPGGVKFAGLKNIALAVDFQEADITGVQYVKELAEIFRSKTTAVHVTGPDFTDDFENFMLKDFSSKMKKKFPVMKLEYKLVKDDDVLSGLNAAVKELKPDVLVMVTEKRSFLGKIFWGSLTKRMAFGTKVPLLAIPAKTK